MSAVLNEFTRPQQGVDPIGKDEAVKMLVAGAVEKMQQAVQAHLDNELILKGFLLGRTTGIIDGLRNMLDLNFGGQQAFDLETIYSHVDLCLQAATDPANHAYLEEALELMQGMASAWEQMPPPAVVNTASQMRV